MRIPADDEIRALHERHAPSAEEFDLVFTHCQIVCRIAEQVVARAGLDVDLALVRAGCLLHDLGVYRVGRGDYIRHGILGHELLRAEGLPQELCRFCSCHTGVGLTSADIAAQGLPLPPGDYRAKTGEEQIVMYADKYHSKKRPPVFVSAATYTGMVGRFGADKAAVFAGLVSRYGEPELGELSAEYGHAVI